MKLRFPRGRSALVFLALVFAMAVPATVAGADGVQALAEHEAASGAPTFEGTRAWFVELTGSTADFHAQAQAVGLKYTERFQFNRLWKGLSVQISPDQVDELEGLRSVGAIYPVVRVRAPELTSVSEPELITALAMTGADVAQSELGLTGHGVRVAVMDTGIDYDNPVFGGDGVTRSDSAVFPTARVITGFDFVGDGFNASGTGAQLIPNPDPRPDDCNGHGSHVAGIVGGNGDVNGENVRGVAPDVAFGAYRVFGCDGSTTSDIMIAAMERALADHMDVLNMSIGAAFQTWPQYPTAKAADALVDQGMVVVASIGNSGANGVLSAGAPGVGNKVIGVASYDNAFATLNFFDATNASGTTSVGYIPASGAPAPPTSGSLDLVKANTVGTVPPGVLPADDGCTAVPAGTYTGKAVLVRRGTCTFYAKALNAQNGGAAAVVLYNNVAGFFAATVTGTPAITIPVVGTSDQLGVALHNMIAAGPTTLTWQPGASTVPNPTGNLISSFSSFGLNAELTVKPDLGAPGGLIRSALPLEIGGVGINSGTSMSSPHVAGGAALLKQARPGLAAGAFRDVLQNSADPKPLSLAPTAGVLDFVHRQGAGMLDIDDSILSTTTIVPGKLSLGESEMHATPKTLTLTNSGSSSASFDVSVVDAATSQPSSNPALIHPFSFSAVVAPSVVSLSASSVTVPAGGTATVDVTISPNDGLTELAQYGGYVVFTPTTPGHPTYRVPFAGLKGDYQSAVAMPTVDLTPFGLPGFAFPTIGREVAPGLFDLFPIGEGGTWDLTSPSQIPNVLVHLRYQSRRLEIHVTKANGNPVHPRFDIVHEEDFLPRASTATGFFAFPWNGTRLHDNGRAADHRKVVPDGQYKLVVKVLKALGDPGNPAHVETWTSPVITIDRP